jgi:hypothetical protein
MNWLDVIGRLMDVVKEEFKSMNAEEIPNLND